MAVAGGLHRDLELEVLVRRIRPGAPEIEVHAGGPQQRPANPDVLRERGRDHTNALRAHGEERVVSEHRLVFVQPLLDEIDGGPALGHPAGRNVVPHAAHLMEAVQQPRADQRLEQVQHKLAFADAVEEDRRATAEGAAHVQAPRAEPEAVRRDPLQLVDQHAQILGALGDRRMSDLFSGHEIRELARHRRDVVGLRRDTRILHVGERFGELLVAAVQVPDDRVDADDGLPLEREDRAEDAVGRRVLRPHVHGEPLGAGVVDRADVRHTGPAVTCTAGAACRPRRISGADGLPSRPPAGYGADRDARRTARRTCRSTRAPSSRPRGRRPRARDRPCCPGPASRAAAPIDSSRG